MNSGEKYTHCWHPSREQLLDLVALFTRVTTLFPAFSVHTDNVTLSADLDDRMNTVVAGFLTTGAVISVGVAPSISSPTPPASPSVTSISLSVVYSGPSAMLVSVG